MATPEKPLKILHVFRAPVGGLFRHVADLVRGQAARGHRVGLIADSTTGGANAEKALAGLAPHLALGVVRVPMSRHAGPGDLMALRRVAARIKEISPDVVHGHGAKGGAYARLAVRRGGAIRVYTPHGGSLLFKPGSLLSRFYFLTERILKPRTDLFLFESAFVEAIYRARVGKPDYLARVVRNGVGPEEFSEVPAASDATDLLYIGELRPIKGIDVLLDAIADLRQRGLKLTATIVGDGPSREELHRHADAAGLKDVVHFRSPMPARQAFQFGRLVLVPSRGESLPYIVLEIAAAGKPLIATHVGGVPEIYGPLFESLIPPGDRRALADAIAIGVNQPETMRATTEALRERVRGNFSLEALVDGGLTAYREALQAHQRLKSP